MQDLPLWKGPGFSSRVGGLVGLGALCEMALCDTYMTFNIFLSSHHRWVDDIFFHFHFVYFSINVCKTWEAVAKGLPIARSVGAACRLSKHFFWRHWSGLCCCAELLRKKAKAFRRFWGIFVFIVTTHDVDSQGLQSIVCCFLHAGLFYEWSQKNVSIVCNVSKLQRATKK